MKFLIPLLLSIASTYSTDPVKRQVVGYTTNVAHQDPQYPDQKAQSTVSVSFNTNESQKAGRYTSSFQKSPTFDNVGPKIANPNTQMFNVGYSVRFKGAMSPQRVATSPQRTAPSFMRPNLDNGEIITGTRKANEQVDVPEGGETTQQFTINSLDEKKHKLSGIKPKSKPKFPITLSKPENVYLSPTTQKYLKDLEQTKPLYKSTEDAKKYHDQTYSWRNLSPSVEIIRSSEIPANGNQEFNHASAIGRGQNFDFSNGVNFKDLNNYQSSASSVFPKYNSYSTNTQFLPPISSNVPTKPVLLSQLPTASPQIKQGIPKLPLDTSLLRDPYLTTNINNVPKNPNVVPVHFNIRPIEEIMKNHLQNNKNYLDQSSNQLAQDYQPSEEQFAPSEYNQNPYEYAQSVHYNQQVQYAVPQSQVAYQSKLKKEETQYEQIHHDPYINYSHLDQTYENQDQVGFQEHQFNQNKHQYKIYGKPQPLKNMKYSGYKGLSKDIINNHRQPRLLQNSYKMALNLRPPPVKQTQFQRKVLVNYY